MKNLIQLGCIVVLLFSSCQKAVNSIAESTPIENPTPTSAKTLYTIKQGQQYCDKNYYQTISINELKFKATFDNTAIYQTVASSNQGDINKLFGFSDNNALHHDFSARFGWRWYNNKLEIFAYNYNNSVVSFQKMGNASIGCEETYSIKVLQGSYLFTFGKISLTMPRTSTTETGAGYKLFPYFGGDEMAPHDIKILIEEL